jgi:hypothetical protein
MHAFRAFRVRGILDFDTAPRRVPSSQSEQTAIRTVCAHDVVNADHSRRRPVVALAAAMAEKPHFYMRIYWAVPDAERTPECLSDGASD